MGILEIEKNNSTKFCRSMSQIEITVRNPITHEDEERKPQYTTYEVYIQTSNKSFCLECSSVRRRFSEFDWLSRVLKSHHPDLSPPSLPPKKFFKGRFDKDFIIFRMKGLEEYLNKVIEEKYYLSDVCLHLLLQTDLTTNEIDDFLQGKMPSHIIDEVWKNGGIKGQCSYFKQSQSEESEISVQGKITPKDDQGSDDSELMASTMSSYDDVPQTDQYNSHSDSVSSSSRSDKPYKNAKEMKHMASFDPDGNCDVSLAVSINGTYTKKT